jgi:thioredoxin-related protein
MGWQGKTGTGRTLCMAVLLAMMTLGAMTPAAARAGEMAWLDLEEGLARQQRESRPLIIFFSLPYCYRCKEMKSWVYTDSQIIDRLNRGFIPVMVDASQDKAPMREYGVESIPTHLFVAPDGAVVLRELGFIPRERLLRMLEFVAGRMYRKLDFKTFVGDE